MNRSSAWIVIGAAALVATAAWSLSCSPDGGGSGGAYGAGPGAGAGAGGDSQTPVTLTHDEVNAIAVDAASVYFTVASGGVKKLPLGGGTAVEIALDPGGFAGAIALDATSVYWVGGTALRKVAKSGGPITTLATGVDAIALAADGAAVYWANRTDTWDPEIDGGQETNPPPIVMKVPADGGAVTVLAAGAGQPTGGLAVDDTSVYWLEADQRFERLQRAPKAGGPATAIFTEPVDPLVGGSLAVDATRVYWTRSADGSVRSVPKGGGAVTALTPAFAASEPSPIAVDATGVYWIASVLDIGPVLLSVGLQGGPIRTLTGEIIGAGVLALSATSVYWTDEDTGLLKVGKVGSSFATGGVTDTGAVDGGDDLGCHPSPPYTVIDPGYASGADSGLVRDETTGLVWTRFAIGQGTDSCDDAYGASQTGAATYCARIGMRLPTELEALGIAAHPDACAWPVAWSIWTSTLAGPELAWNVSPTGEAAQNVGDGAPAFNVLCVAGTCTPPGSCACAAVGAACTSDPECCSHACQGGTCACSAVGAECAQSPDCCLTTCDTDAGGCACAPPGNACAATTDCCLGTCQSGTCVCSPTGAVCSADTLCCSGTCDNGACACIGAAQPCGSGPTCCSGTCTAGACACAAAGLPCAALTDCCSGSCQSGTCACAPAGTACTSDALCCSGTCTGGACAP